MPTYQLPPYLANMECGKPTNKRETRNVRQGTELPSFPFSEGRICWFHVPDGPWSPRLCLLLSCFPSVADKPEPNAFTKWGRGSPRPWLSLFWFGFVVGKILFLHFPLSPPFSLLLLSLSLSPSLTLSLALSSSLSGQNS